ncbi:MAG TPA: ABC transporter substrate-binding protein [Acidimicrobiia bacterium]|nr:ABC transporter substrate-binding protein [Acidimicrobiia bacterium]
MAVPIGILLDVPAADGGNSTADMVRFAIDEVAASPAGTSLPGIELVVGMAEGHPRGTGEAVADGLRDLAAQGVIGVIGPAISDNALACVPVADALQVPCINWTGSEQTRSEWMFHYQVGSLEDEPFVIARYLADHGLRRIALVREDSFIGRQYASFFDDAVLVSGLELLGTVDLDVSGGNGAEAVAGVEALAPDAVVYFGLGMSAPGLAEPMRGRPWPVATNSALMFGHMNPEWRAGFEGWTYIDAFDEENPVREQLHTRLGLALDEPGPAYTYDMGRLMALGVAHAPSPTSEGVRDGLERVKQVPAALGSPGTIMGFGRWKRCALEGGYLVLRQWRGGKSVRARD